MHIVISGEGELAIRIAEALMASHRVVLISSDAMTSSRVEHLDISTIEGTASSLAALEAARVETASYFIAASSSDERNIVACIAADRSGAKRTICFLSSTRDPDLDALDDRSLIATVGIDEIVRPAEQLANEIVRIVTVPGALAARNLLGGRLGLVISVVKEHMPIAGATLEAQRLGKGVRATTVHRGDAYLIPGDDFVFEVGDRVVAVGSRRALRRFVRRSFRDGSRGRERRRAVIAGGGQVGLLVAKGLREAGWWVKVIEQSRARCNALANQLDCLVLHGDGSDLELLQEEHIETMSALVAVTDNDEKNLLISLIAKHLGVDRIVTRADKRINERIFEKVGVDVALSATGAAVSTVVSDIILGDDEHVAELEHGDLEVLDLELPAHFTKRRLDDCKPQTKASLGAIIRGRRTIIPGDRDEVRPGDHIIVICPTAEEAATRAYFLASPTAQPINGAASAADG